MSIEKWRGRKALALAVLLWMAWGNKGESMWIQLESDQGNRLTVSGAPPVGAEISHSGKSLTVSGGEWSSSLDWYLRGGSTSRMGIGVRGYRLEISGATGLYAVYGGEAYGNDSVRGDAAENSVTIRGNSRITGVVCGGLSGWKGDATENSVTVSDSVVTGTVFGGKSDRYGSARENVVAVKNSRVHTIYGGYSGDGDATGNRVIVRNSRAADVYGGFGDVGKRETDNIVVLDHANISGRVCGASENARDWDGCTLVLSGGENTADNVQRFEEIKLSETLSWRNRGTLLRAGAFEEWGKQVDVSEADFSSVTAPGVMTLLSSDRENDFAELTLKYRGGTARLNGTNPSQEVWAGREGTRSKQGVKLSYRPVHRVLLDDGNRYRNVLYRVENQVHAVSLGEIVWRTGGTAHSLTSGYDFTEAVLDAGDLRFQNPEAVPGSGTMALLSGAEHLPFRMECAGISSPYAYTPVPGVTVNGHISGAVSVEGDRLLYSVRENRADRIAFGRVAWKEEGALLVRPSNIVFDGAAVDTSRIYFHNVASLRANQSMVLVEDFGNSVGRITGDTYTVGTTLTGRGRASLSGGNLIYRVETGTESPEPVLGGTKALAPADPPVAQEPAAVGAQTPENHGTPLAGGATAANDGEAATEHGREPEANAMEILPPGMPLASESEPILAAQEQTHNTVMGMEAGMAALAAGNDCVAQAMKGLAARAGADGVSVFAAMGGGRTEYETGSYVSGNTWNAILALGTKHAYPKGTLEWGGFLEHGGGNFSIHGNTGRGSLSSSYTGGGMLVKWTNRHGVYAEGSLRGGRMHDSASDILRDALGGSYGYDIRANYRGGHVGVGKIYRFHGNRSLDIYGKFFVMRREGISFQAGGRYDLDDVTSRMLRLGVRYSMEGQKWNWYGGLSWDWEFDGEASGTADGVPIRSASVRGGTLGVELGIRTEPTESSPWKVDVGLSGHLGKHRGLGGSVAVAYMF